MNLSCNSAVWLTMGACLSTAISGAPPASAPGTDIFSRPTRMQFAIRISEADAASLRRNPREAIPAAIQCGTNSYTRVALHIKGAQGSFRPLDEKPSFTLNFAKLEDHQRFFGLRKIHLNNSAQDPTYLCEDLAGELFRRAGVPAPRTAWATVELNGRKLGLFVLKEGYTKDFLRLHFKDATGNLYDGGLHHEIIEPLELDSGDGPRDHADLKKLAAAAQAPAGTRWAQLKQVLDTDRFAAYLALEVLANDIDGYPAMQNNYRLYFDPAGGAVFLPHGTDRMFYEPKASLEPYTKALVAGAFVGTAEGRALYDRRLAEITERVFQPEWLTNRINELVRLLETAEPLVAREAQPLKARIAARAAFAHSKLGAKR